MFETETILIYYCNVTGEPPARKAIIISIVLLILSQYSGIFIFINFASQIFSDAGAAFHPNIATIIIGCLQLIGSYSSTLLIDRAGRRVSRKQTFIFYTNIRKVQFLE